MTATATKRLRRIIGKLLKGRETADVLGATYRLM
jgi:hypothetical protein